MTLASKQVNKSTLLSLLFLLKKTSLSLLPVSWSSNTGPSLFSWSSMPGNDGAPSSLWVDGIGCDSACAMMLFKHCILVRVPLYNSAFGATKAHHFHLYLNKNCTNTESHWTWEGQMLPSKTWVHGRTVLCRRYSTDDPTGYCYTVLLKIRTKTDHLRNGYESAELV